VSTRHSEGDIFYRNSEDLSWKQIVGVNPLPRGASVVEELGKNLSPSKRQSCRICEYIHECALGWKILFHDKGTFMKTS
jgi:hypothetical protein